MDAENHSDEFPKTKPRTPRLFLRRFFIGVFLAHRHFAGASSRIGSIIPETAHGLGGGYFLGVFCAFVGGIYCFSQRHEAHKGKSHAITPDFINRHSDCLKYGIM